jgi:hypothetical protein
MLAVAGAYFLRSWRLGRADELGRRMLPWFAVAGFALIAAAMGAISRIQIGMAQSLGSRYCSFSLYLTLGVTMLWAVVLQDLHRRGRFPTRTLRGIAWGLAILLLVAEGLALPRGLAFADVWQATHKRDKGLLLLVQVLPNNPMLQSSIPDPNDIISQAGPLNALGYLRPRLIETANASLLEDNGKTPFARGEISRIFRAESGQLVCAGWAELIASNRAADAVFITCDNERGEPIIIATALTGAQWPGVVPARPDSWQGWVATIPLARLPQGLSAYHFSAWALDTQSGRACRIDAVAAGD